MTRKLLTNDGRELSLRLLGAADITGNLPKNSVYRNFFNCFNCPVPKNLSDFTLFNCEREQATALFTAENGIEKPVAMGRLCRIADRNCEIAVVVDESWRTSGVRSLLMEELHREALRRGLVVCPAVSK